MSNLKGRNEKKIDWVLVDELLMKGCLGNEIAAVFGMHPHTFYDRVNKQYGVTFTDYQQEKRCCGKSILRAAQFDKAIGATKKGDNALLIWLGKQYLDQKETNEITATKDTVEKFAAIMKQVSSVQGNSKETIEPPVSLSDVNGHLSDLNIADSNINNAEKS